MKKITGKVITGIAAGTLILSMGMTAFAATDARNMQAAPDGRQQRDFRGMDDERPELPDGELPEPPNGESSKPSDDEMQMHKKGGMSPDGRGDGRMRDIMMIDTDAVGEEINALEDEAVREELESLLEEYRTALDAQKEALDSWSKDSDTEPDRDAMVEYDEAVRTAADALISALNDAGIEAGSKLPDDIKGDGGREWSEEFRDSGRMDQDKTDKDADANVDADADGFFAKLGSWLRSLFNK